VIAAAAVAALVAAAPIAPGAAPPVELTKTCELVELPVPAAATAVTWNPLERRLTVKVPAAQAAAVARRIEGTSHLCGNARVSGGAVVLHCRTARLRASVGTRTTQTLLELYDLTVPSWRDAEEGPPTVALDPALVAGGPCPGTTPAGRGECLLAQGHLDEARKVFEAAPRSAHTELRLGDLALAADDPTAAVRHWRAARHEAPWGRLAAARLCELEPSCLDGPGRAAVFDPAGADPAVRADLALRAVRLRALEGDLVGAAREAAQESRPGGACGAAQRWCRHLVLLALELPPPDGADALAIWVELPDRNDGPLALELTLRASDQAEATGAPVFAANLLASLVGVIPPASLPAHLLRTARLFLAGRDHARADEILTFARTRVPEPEWASPPWTSLRRAVRAQALDERRAKDAAAAEQAATAELGATRQVLDDARLVSTRSRRTR
jgi:hypothetical protein